MACTQKERKEGKGRRARGPSLQAPPAGPGGRRWSRGASPAQPRERPPRNGDGAAAKKIYLGVSRRAPEKGGSSRREKPICGRTRRENKRNLVTGWVGRHDDATTDHPAAGSRLKHILAGDRGTVVLSSSSCSPGPALSLPASSACRPSRRSHPNRQNQRKGQVDGMSRSPAGSSRGVHILAQSVCGRAIKRLRPVGGGGLPETPRFQS